MRDRAFIATWALLGALTAAVLAAPVGQISVDNPPGCATCPQGATVLLVGLHAPATYPVWMWVLGVILGAGLFAAIASLYAFNFRD